MTRSRARWSSRGQNARRGNLCDSFVLIREISQMNADSNLRKSACKSGIGALFYGCRGLTTSLIAREKRFSARVT